MEIVIQKEILKRLYVILIMSVVGVASLWSQIDGLRPEQFADTLISYSRKFIGTRYRGGGNTPAGFDCSGFTSFIYGKFGIELVHQSAGQVQNSRAIPKGIKAMQRGDLVFFGGRRRRGIGHVGIITDIDTAAGIFYFIHSSNSRGIVISDSREPYYAARFVYARRVLPDFVDYDAVYGHSPVVTDNSIPVVESDTSAVVQPSLQPKPEPEKPKPVYHVIKRGDTLSALARRYHTSVAAICRLNGIKETKILQLDERLRVR